MSAESVWFYEVSGERRGPVGSVEILRLHRLGELTHQSLVWREGLADWIPFSNSELAGQGRATPPPRPSPPVTPPPVPSRIEPFVPREARLRSGFRPTIRSCYGRAWELLRGNFWPLVGCFALTSLILGVASQFYIPIFFMMYPLMGGLYWYILQCVRGRERNIDLLFEGCRRQFGPLAVLNLIIAGVGVVVLILLAAIIVAGIVAVSAGGGGFEEKFNSPGAIAVLVGGSLLLSFLVMIPLLVLGHVGNFATLLILDCGLQAKEAMSLAWTASKPFIVKIVLFMLVNGFLSTIGMLALYVGVFITGAWATIAVVYLYEDAFGDKRVAG